MPPRDPRRRRLRSTKASSTEDTSSWARRDWLCLVLLFAGTLVSRIPFRTGLLYTWDAVLYARAIRSFNVARGLPQPPGHIFYVGLIWLVDRLLGDANASMVWVSAFFGAASVAALYWLGRSLFGRRVALAAALLLATSLSFWAYSEIAYPYTLLCFLNIVVAAAAYRLWRGQVGWALPAALILGVAGGFREEMLAFMAPLLIVGLWRAGRWRILGAAGILAVCTAAWYAPSALLSGGFKSYQSASSAQSNYVIDYFSVLGRRGLAAIADNLSELRRYLLLGVAAGAPLLALFVAGLPLRLTGPLGRNRRLWFLLLWMAPSALFYVFIHVGEYGYVFSILPGAFLVGCWSLDGLAGRLNFQPGGKWTPGRFFAAVSGFLVAANLLMFLVLSTPMSANRIAARDTLLRCHIEKTKNDFDPSHTLVVSVFDFQDAKYYLPRYRAWTFDISVDQHPSLRLSPGITKVVIFDDFLHPAPGAPTGSVGKCLDLPMKYLNVGNGRRLVVDWPHRTVNIVR